MVCPGGRKVSGMKPGDGGLALEMRKWEEG